MIDGETRRYAATLGRRHFSGRLPLEALVEHFGESEDPLIRALLEAAVHEPHRGHGGVSQARWEREFWVPVSGLLEELERGSDGRSPTRRVYPRDGIGPVFGWAAVVLVAGASAAEHALRIMSLHASGLLWETPVEYAFLVLMAGSTFIGIRTTLHKLYLFRTRDNPYGSSNQRAG